LVAPSITVAFCCFDPTSQIRVFSVKKPYLFYVLLVGICLGVRLGVPVIIPAGHPKSEGITVNNPVVPIVS
jgi:hypothetical protein